MKYFNPIFWFGFVVALVMESMDAGVEAGQDLIERIQRAKRRKNYDRIKSLENKD